MNEIQLYLREVERIASKRILQLIYIFRHREHNKLIEIKKNMKMKSRSHHFTIFHWIHAAKIKIKTRVTKSRDKNMKCNKAMSDASLYSSHVRYTAICWASFTTIMKEFQYKSLQTSTRSKTSSKTFTLFLCFFRRVLLFDIFETFSFINLRKLLHKLVHI